MTNLANLENTKQYNLNQFIEARKTKKVKWATNDNELTEAEKDSLESAFRNAPVRASTNIVPDRDGSYYEGEIPWKARKRAIPMPTAKDIQIALRYRPLIIVKTHEVPVDPSKVVITSKGINIDVSNFPEDRFEDGSEKQAITMLEHLLAYKLLMKDQGISIDGNVIGYLRV